MATQAQKNEVLQLTKALNNLKEMRGSCPHPQRKGLEKNIEKLKKELIKKKEKYKIMAKVAKLVEVSFTTRVIVEEDATEYQIIQASKKGFQVKLDNDEIEDNLVLIEDDEECPFGTFDTDK
jgi:hypothetical protein